MEEDIIKIVSYTRVILIILFLSGIIRLIVTWIKDGTDLKDILIFMFIFLAGIFSVILIILWIQHDEGNILDIIGIVSLIINLVIIFSVLIIYCIKEGVENCFEILIILIVLGLLLYPILFLISTGIYHLIKFFGSSIGEFFKWFFDRLYG